MYFVCLFVFLLLLTFSFYLFLFFVRVKICLLNPTQNVVSSIFEEWYLEKSETMMWIVFFFFSLFFFTVHLQHAGKVPRQQSTRSQQHSSALDPDRLIWSAALMPLKSLRKPLHHLFFFSPIDNFSLSLLLLAAWLDLIYETKCAFAGWLKQSFGTSIKSHLMSYECRNLSTSPRLTFTTARIIIGAGKLTLTWWCQGWLWIFLFFFCLYECTMTRTSHI